MMMLILIFLLLIVSVLLFMLIFFSLQRYFLTKQRLDKITLSYAPIRTDSLNQQDKIKHTYLSGAKLILNRFHILSSDTTKNYTKRLANAGWLSKNALVIFLSTQIITLFIMFIIAILAISLAPQFEGSSFRVKGLVLIAAMLIGYRLPVFYLSKRTRSYHTILRRSFLDFLDLFLICIEAGFSNDKALERVAKELKQLHPELIEQINLLITELNILPQRRAAWENFATRTGIEETKVIAQIINQSEQLGSSISQALRSQVEMFRNERLSFVEQKAMRLPTLLTLPLVIFILPALFLVLLGPAILTVIDVFGRVGR